MRSVSLPASWAHLLMRLIGCLRSEGSFQNLRTLLSGWVLCPGRRTLSRIVQAGSGIERPKHHSALYRFLSRAQWRLGPMGKVLFELVLPRLPRRIEVLVDDTLSRKSGSHLFGAAMHYDPLHSNYGSKSVRFGFGHNWVTLALWVPLPWGRERGVALPVLFRLYRSKKHCPEELYRKRTELAREMVQELLSWLPAGREVVLIADAEYACRTLVRGLPPQVCFVGPMHPQAALYEPPPRPSGRGRPRVKGLSLAPPAEVAAFEDWPWTKRFFWLYGRNVGLLFKQHRCLWYSVAASRQGKMVVTRDPTGRLPDRAYFCTDPRATVEQILRRVSHRWALELCYRDAKQLLGLEEPQNGWWRRLRGTPRPPRSLGVHGHAQRGQKAVERTTPLGFVTYDLVVLWYLLHGQPAEDVEAVRAAAPWYRHKLTPSFADMLAALRRELWTARFSRDPDSIGLHRKSTDPLEALLLAA